MLLDGRFHHIYMKAITYQWTESIAVGDREFVMETKAKLGAKAFGRRELENNEGYELKEPQPVGS